MVIEWIISIDSILVTDSCLSIAEDCFGAAGRNAVSFIAHDNHRYRSASRRYVSHRWRWRWRLFAANVCLACSMQMWQWLPQLLHVLLLMVSCCRVAAAAAAACHLLPINTTTCRWQSRWWTKAGNVAKKQCNARRRKEGGRGAVEEGKWRRARVAHVKRRRENC